MCLGINRFHLHTELQLIIISCKNAGNEFDVMGINTKDGQEEY